MPHLQTYWHFLLFMTVSTQPGLDIKLGSFLLPFKTFKIMDKRTP